MEKVSLKMLLPHTGRQSTSESGPTNAVKAPRILECVSVCVRVTTFGCLKKGEMLSGVDTMVGTCVMSTGMQSKKRKNEWSRNM